MDTTRHPCRRHHRREEQGEGRETRPQHRQAHGEPRGQRGMVAREGPVPHLRALADHLRPRHRATGPLLVHHQLQRLTHRVGDDRATEGQDHSDDCGDGTNVTATPARPARAQPVPRVRPNRARPVPYIRPTRAQPGPQGRPSRPEQQQTENDQYPVGGDGRRRPHPRRPIRHHPVHLPEQCGRDPTGRPHRPHVPQPARIQHDDRHRSRDQRRRTTEYATPDAIAAAIATIAVSLRSHTSRR